LRELDEKILQLRIVQVLTRICALDTPAMYRRESMWSVRVC